MEGLGLDYAYLLCNICGFWALFLQKGSANGGKVKKLHNRAVKWGGGAIRIPHRDHIFYIEKVQCTVQYI
jgi:hypothetical protein